MDHRATIVLYGVGLINGSVGLALKARGFKGRIVGTGRRAETLETASEVGAIDDWTLDAAKALEGAQIAVVGAPVDCVAEIVRRLAAHAEPDTVFTDVGSAKAEIVSSCARLAPNTRFVGAHPIAGLERSGAKAARATLFENATCVLTPTAATRREDAERVRGLWERVGARVIELSPQTHDALLAASSHLPHVVASALARVVAESVVDGRSALDFAGGGFRDTTRIAAGSVEMWAPILQANAQAVAPAVRKLARELDAIAGAIESGDVEAICGWLARASRIRRALDEKESDGV